MEGSNLLYLGSYFRTGVKIPVCIVQMQAADPAGLDLQNDGATAPKNAITLPENYNAISFMDSVFDSQ